MKTGKSRGKSKAKQTAPTSLAGKAAPLAKDQLGPNFEIEPVNVPADGNENGID